MYLLKKKGFTLIELLIVITIIGVLVLIFVPKIKSSLNNSDVSSNVLKAKNLETKIMDYFTQTNTYPTKSGVPDTSKAKMVIDSVLDSKGLDKSDYSKYGFSYIDATKLNLKQDTNKFFMATSGGLEGMVFFEDTLIDSKGVAHSGAYFVTNFSGGSVSPKIVTNGLIAYYHHKQGISGSNWSNIVPANGIGNATLSGGNLTPSGYYFDGSTILHLPYISYSNNNLTLELGFVIEDGKVTYPLFIKGVTTNNLNVQFDSDQYYPSLKGRVDFYIGNSYTHFFSYSPISNTYDQFALTRNGTLEKTYYNSNYQSQATFAFTANDLGFVDIGDGLRGHLKYIRIYNRVLSNSEIQQNYQAGSENIGL